MGKIKIDASQNLKNAIEVKENSVSILSQKVS